MKKITTHRPGGKIVLWLIIIAALVYTATRTVHFLAQTFPPDQAYMAYFALAMFDVGSLAWLYFALNSAQGQTQRSIAFGMVFVCLAGSLVTTIMDMTLVSAQRGYYQVPADWFRIGLWACIIVICLNVAAGLVVHIVDPESAKKMALQSVHDEIHDMTLQHIRQQAAEIAPRIAQATAEHWASQTVTELTGHIPGQKVIDSPRNDKPKN